MNRWFEALGDLLTKTARERHVSINAPALEPPVAEELLELARVTAHTQERRFAPLACYIAGIAVERLRQRDARLNADGVAAYIHTVWQELEREAAARPSSPG